MLEDKSQHRVEWWSAGVDAGRWICSQNIMRSYGLKSVKHQGKGGAHLRTGSNHQTPYRTYPQTGAGKEEEGGKYATVPQLRWSHRILHTVCHF